MCKIPLLADMVADLVDEGKSVAVFLSFKASLAALKAALKIPAVEIHGDIKPNDREAHRLAFQRNEVRVILLTIQTGGVGMSLHDLHGGHPRVSLITPTYNAVHLKQALGRTPRDGAKSKSIQRILFAAGTVEEKACKSVRKKLDNIAAINDGDLAVSLFD